MKRNTTVFFATLLAVITLMFSSAESSSAQGKSKGNGSGKGRGLSSIFDWARGKKKDDRKMSGKGSVNRYKGLSKKLGRSPESLRAWYESERAANPRLTYGQFVAANMVSRNLRKGISAQTILTGLRNGDSIGQVLHRRGVSEKQIREERKRIRKAIDEDRDHEYDYDDLDRYWRIIR